ncbi:MAG: peptidoglycan bridge formation glycyltransferase FemA/FemB family protein [Firmicutes bacterium]|nr:peptidoglycan bridge formation glycyltransferase FemA/FemB family protein [Bacillota bacterium]
MRLQMIDKNDAARFDAFIAAAPSGDILQTYSWGEIKSPDWDPVRAIVIADDGKIRAAMSVLFRQIPLLKRTIAYVPRGPVLDDTKDFHLWEFTLSALTELAQKHRAIVLKMDPAVPDNAELAAFLSRHGFRLTGQEHDFGGMQPRYTFRLSLKGTLEEIFARFNKKMRYKINYGPKRGLVFRQNEETSIADFFSVLRQTGARNDFMVRSQAYFQKMYEILRQDDRILLLTGYIEDKPVISSITFALGNKAWAVYGGQANKYRNMYTYHALNWERIKWAHGKGAEWFDLYGVPGHVDEDHPLYGLYHFKKSFGGDYVAFIGEWDKPLSPTLYWLWDKGLPRYRALLRKLKS